MDALSPGVTNLIIFVLAIYVGYHVVWNVTPALHTPTDGGDECDLRDRDRRRHAGSRPHRRPGRSDHGHVGGRTGSGQCLWRLSGDPAHAGNVPSQGTPRC